MKEIHNSKPIIQPEIGMIVAVLAISTGSIFIRLMQEDVSPMVVALYRLGISSLVLMPLALQNRREIGRLRRQEWVFLWVGGFSLAMHFVTWISSLQYTSVLSSVVFVNTSPIWVALLSPVLLGESLSRKARRGMGLAMLGMLLVALSGAVKIADGQMQWMGFQMEEASQPLLGNFLAMLGAWSATGFLLVGRKLRSSLSLMPYTFLLYGSAALIMGGIVLVTGQPLGGYARISYVWLLGIALVPQLIGHSMANWALRYASAAYVSVVLLAEPVGASVLALIFLGEVPGVVEVIGSVVIMAGIYLVTKANA